MICELIWSCFSIITHHFLALVERVTRLADPVSQPRRPDLASAIKLWFYQMPVELSKEYAYILFAFTYGKKVW